MSEPELIQRSCGDCQACCVLFAIEEAGTPERQPCQHLCKRGCGIYADRPAACRDYECWWVQGDPNLKARDRPDRLGVIFDKRSSRIKELDGLKSVFAHELRPGAFKGKRAANWIAALEGDRIVVKVSYSGKRELTGPRPLLAELERRQAGGR